MVQLFRKRYTSFAIAYILYFKPEKELIAQLLTFSSYCKRSDKPGYVGAWTARMVIYLELLLPTVSSDPPENRSGKPIVFCLVLLRMGFTCAPLVTSRAVVSYTAFPPLPGKPGGLFLLHWPWSHLHRTLSGILPCEARTFLTSV